ncbi:hypothetical protein AcV7_004548 [Taiwanofungus camphoratus]|nr:hypothetical protein AcV7_004548 [Antrodia cinnamomea]
MVNITSKPASRHRMPITQLLMENENDAIGPLDKRYNIFLVLHNTTSAVHSIHDRKHSIKGPCQDKEYAGLSANDIWIQRNEVMLTLREIVLSSAYLPENPPQTRCCLVQTLLQYCIMSLLVKCCRQIITSESCRIHSLLEDG